MTVAKNFVTMMSGTLFEHTLMHWMIAASAGLVIGSFLNVVIHRMPLMLQAQWRREEDSLTQTQLEDSSAQTYHLAWPGSHCPHCSTALRWYENIPLISYAWLRGRCRHCDQHISWQYPIVELLSMGAALLCFTRHGWTAEAIAWFVFLGTLLCLAWIDWQTQLLPDNLTLPLAWLGLIAAERQWIGLSLNDAVWGCVAGYLSLYGINALFRSIKGQAGMGHGDFKMLAALGAWWGWQNLPFLVLLASVCGILHALIGVKFFARKPNEPIAFGPWLATAGAAPLLWPSALNGSLKYFTAL
jgi:leader peptidase (prepilin peptidase) / N-methyltransferase